MKKVLFLTCFSIIVASIGCGGDEKKSTETTSQEPQKAATEEAGAYDPTRGEGKYTAESVVLTDKIDGAMATAGESVSKVKCFSCHKANDEKLVGPGWKGVTSRRTPEWILNFITDPDPMLNKDPQAQAMLELCLIRMPNQNLTDQEAREILEYMRQNDKK